MQVSFFYTILRVVASNFWAYSVIILCAVSCAQVSGEFLKVAFFNTWAQFFKFPWFKFNSWKFSFLCLLKHNKQGFQQLVVFLLFTEKKAYMIIGIVGLGILSKMAASWRLIVFAFLACWRPYILQCFLGARFLGQLVKKVNVGPPPPRNFGW